MAHAEHDLALSVRAAKLARDVGATTVGELAQFTALELLSAKCFGETSLKEIEQKLAERGLRLGMSAAELRGRPEAKGKVVVQLQAPRQPAEPEHDGPCCDECQEAARKLRERTSTRPNLRRTLPENV